MAHQAVQACHASISAARDLLPAGLQHPSLVLCTVPDEQALLTLRDQCIQSGIPVRVFVETDMGEQMTALATAPVDAAGRKIFKTLPLYTGT